MRFTPIIAGLLLVSSAAVAQPAPQGGPGYDQPPPYQAQPDQPQPDQAQQPGQDGGMAPPMQQGQPQSGQPQGRMQHGGNHMMQRFQAANTTHDGRLTLEQAQTGHLGMVVRNFGQIDADRKGYVTAQDIKSWHHAMHQAKLQQQQAAPQQ